MQNEEGESITDVFLTSETTECISIPHHVYIYNQSWIVLPHACQMLHSWREFGIECILEHFNHNV